MKIKKIKNNVFVFLFLITISYFSVAFAKKTEVVNLSKYFIYETSVRIDGYVIGWLEMPHLSNAVLISSDDKYWSVRGFAPKSSLDRQNCNYHYINPDFPKKDASKGLYFWLDQVINSKVEISNFKNGTLLKPKFKRHYYESDSFYSKKILFKFPGELYFFSDGDYFLYMPQNKKGKMKKWDEYNKDFHPFSIDEIKKGLEYVSQDARNWLYKRLKSIEFQVYKE
ncbi:hypothetical protein KAT08_04340 [Candidatus Babeliales bacterium]|nr:hypothetical protein [Candidatus Babeliales bacterium]